ncbi:MAG TPA: bifunctional folylpolyglutamate synthase/dihydrofolate synthase, partial [Candidatus Latescibacteria bacterium]|nr:bifunctional folylpolyglutamate synthase/dihydrofolate synthase [Candidatus Latescibacterota bacterium]
MTYREAEAFLFSLIDFEKRKGFVRSLEPFRAFLEELGNPHRKLPPSILVVGTKGKGSTVVHLVRGLMDQGFRVGSFSSPHLVRGTERIRINESEIPPERFAGYVARMKPVLHGRRGYRTVFEALTAMAFLYFVEEGVDWAVFEAGLGGRLDATNVVDQRCTVITRIGFDHTDILGDTMAQIAREKAAVIKSAQPVISTPQDPEALAVIERRAEEKGAPLTVLGRDVPFALLSADLRGSRSRVGDAVVETTLPGLFQAENAAVAHLALSALGYPVRSFRDLSLEGRFEVVQKEPLALVLDGAHNPTAARALVRSIQALFPDRKQVHIVFGVSRGKDIRGILKALQELSPRFYFTRAQVIRAEKP